MNYEIVQLETLNTFPDLDDYPPSPWGQFPTNGQKYDSAFEVETQEDADMILLVLVGHSLQFGYIAFRADNGFLSRRRMTWREAFRAEREALAFYALAKDVCPFLYRGVGPDRVENTKARDFVWKFYRAELPASVMRTHEPDILERVHRKNEKAAKARGETYQRNIRKNAPPESDQIQGSLF